MGYIKHNAIIVTWWKKEEVEMAHAKTIEIFTSHFGGIIDYNGAKLVSPILAGVVNDQYSFFIAPDGSKEGWEPSDKGNRAREQFCDWLRDNNGCNYVDIRFGGDDEGQFFVRSKSMDLENEETFSR